MKHEKRRFIRRVDYVTSPGWIDGLEGRKRLGLLPDKGPRAVITELGILRFDSESRRMYLAEVFPNVRVEDVLENTGFSLDTDRCVESPPPTEEELLVLSTKVDPAGMMT